MLWEISEGRRVKPSSEIYRPGDLLPYTLQVISRKCALLLGQCVAILNMASNVRRYSDSKVTPWCGYQQESNPTPPPQESAPAMCCSTPLGDSILQYRDHACRHNWM
jgi:hypothetical protein